MHITAQANQLQGRVIENLSWCKVSSLTASVASGLKGIRYPVSRAKILNETSGVVIEGWDLSFFLGEALSRRSYGSLRHVMTDVEAWAERQG